MPAACPNPFQPSWGPIPWRQRLRPPIWLPSGSARREANTLGALTRETSVGFRFAAKPLDQLTALDVARFADHLLGSGLAPISRARTLTAVRSLLRSAAFGPYLWPNGRLDRQPCGS